VKRLYLNIAGFAVILLAGAGIIFFYDNEPDVIKGNIPPAQTYNTPVPSPDLSKSPSPSIAPVAGELNLAVPFTPQAPHGNWEDPYGEFCEEASALMAAAYIKGFDIPNPDFVDQKLNEIKDFELKKFGYHLDTTVAETAVILEEFYGIDKVQILNNPTLDDMVWALSEKRVIIIPAAGRQLGNPYYTQPGPLYHMLVIKGFTKEGNFITNDPGTRRGANFIYSPDVIMNAIHDWNGGDVENGKKAIIIVG
jgi:hypothetical protein